MSSQMNPKVRLVRCPKCQLVLPELADVPVYKCGGCGTVLQAKNRKNAPIKNNGLDVASQVEIGSTSQEASPPPKGEEGCAEDCKKEQPQRINSPNDLPSSSGLSYLDKEDTLSKFAEHEGDEHSCGLNEKTEQYENGYQDHEKEFSGGGNFCNRLSISDQLHESGSPITEAKEDEEGSTIEEREQLELDKDIGRPTLEVTEELELDGPVDHCTVTVQSESGVGKKMLNSPNENSTFSECINHRDEVSIQSGVHEDGTESKSLVQKSIGRGQNDFQGTNAEPSENISYAKEGPLSTELACGEIERQSSVCSDMDQSPLNESTISDPRTSTDHEQLEQYQKEIPSGFDRVSSVDTLENLPLNICGSEPPVNLRKMIKSPTNRSYYGYDGSASSCDGDDHIPDQFHQQTGRKFKERYPVNPSELHLDDRCRVNNTMRNESKILRRAIDLSTTLPRKNHHTIEGNNWTHEEWPQSRKRGQASGSRLTLDKDEHDTAFPFISSDSRTGHKHGNPSSYRKNVVPHSSLHPPRTPLNPEPDKIELLRMVYELEDQLRQTRITKRMPSRRFCAEVMRGEEYTPLYYNQFPAEDEVGADLNYSRYPVRSSHGEGWPQQRKSSRIPFSAEAAHYRHRADCLCLHCSPQVRHCSAQLHPSVGYNKDRRVDYSSYNYCNHLHSGSSSPHHYSSSEYSRWDHDTKSDDRRQKDHEMKKLYLREKYSKMRHLRPVAGGAPIIACYHCSELLHLPADFLLFKRRCHQLRCNACRKVLKVSLQNQIHVVPFNEEALAPPPSEVDGYSDSIDQQNLAFAYHSNSCPHTEPVSCSDDLGPSFCRSCSTEGESSLPPIQPNGRTSFNRMMSPGSSSGPTKDRKMKSVLREPHRGGFESPESSAKMSKWGKVSSEIEEVRPNAGSPLHRLMGYSSPSEVIHW